MARSMTEAGTENSEILAKCNNLDYTIREACIVSESLINVNSESITYVRMLVENSGLSSLSLNSLARFEYEEGSVTVPFSSPFLAGGQQDIFQTEAIEPDVDLGSLKTISILPKITLDTGEFVCEDKVVRLRPGLDDCQIP